MRRSRSFLAFMMFALLIGCDSSDTAPVFVCDRPDISLAPDFVNAKGTIIKRGFYFSIVPDPPQAYLHYSSVYPQNLAEAFEKDGLRVAFSGKIVEQECPDVGQCVGPSMCLLAIREIE